jgi:hypothetical protein
MVFIDLRCFIVLIVVDAINTSIVFFTCFTFMHFMTFGAVWAYILPIPFLCSMIVFATFVATSNAQIVVTVTYVPTYFEFPVH